MMHVAKYITMLSLWIDETDLLAKLSMFTIFVPYRSVSPWNFYYLSDDTLVLRFDK